MFGTPEWPVHDLVEALICGEWFQDRGILPYKTVWEPACGKGRLVESLEQSIAQFDVIGTDILTGTDFLTCQPPSKYDLIITNPPFSLKDQFLKRCYDLEVPFALLLPVQSISGIKRSKMFKDRGMQVLVLPKRVDFEYSDGTYKGKPWFSCCWLVHGFELQKDIDWL